MGSAFFYYVLISISAATGLVTISPFPTEYACEDAKRTVLAGVEQLKAHGAVVAQVAVVCKPILSKQGKES